MSKLLAVVAVLGVAGAAVAAEHWRGAGWGGDGTSWNDALNWDDMIPWNTSWDVNGTGEQGTPGNHVINVNQSGTVSGGTVYDQTGYSVVMTVLSGITLTSSLGNGVMWSGAGSLSIQANAIWDMKNGQFGPNNGSFTATIEAGGLLYCSALRHNNGAMVDVYGELRAWKVSRISAEGTYRLAVYEGGLFRVDSAADIPVVGSGWSEGGKVTQYAGSTVMLAGDHTGHYLDLVQAGEPGAWDAVYDGEYTYVTYIPCNPLVFADVDEDGDVDQQDFGAFQICFTGDGGGVLTDPDYCQCFDRRNNDNSPGQDNDVDSFDLAAFEDCASGPGMLADPTCDD